MKETNLLVILGPTASGKTNLAVLLARHLNGEVISADSRQVYRGLDIGSGKDLAEYEDIPYHLIDIVDPGYEFSVFDFQQYFIEAYRDITGRGCLPVMAGGSSLYIDCVLNNYQLVPVTKNPELRQRLAKYDHNELQKRLLQLKPKQHNTTDLLDSDRLIRAIEIAEGEAASNVMLPQLPQLTPLIIGIQFERNITRERITQRLEYRMNNGLIEEVEALHSKGVTWETLEYFGLEYRLVAKYLQQRLSRTEMFDKLNIAIHQFAKKQDTWLRRLQKNGHIIHWVDGEKNTFEQALSILNDTTNNSANGTNKSS